jgi:glycine betaine catabolism B
VCRAKEILVHVVSIASACLFVFLAGFNVWNMLTSRGASARSRRLWMQGHRAAGYAFIAMFAMFCYFMLQRVKGLQDELPPRLLLHASLALALAPLLAVKVLVARYQKTARGLLAALGIVILTVSFTLIVLNVAARFLRTASSAKLSPPISWLFVTAVLSFAGIAFLRRRSGSEPQSVGEPSAGNTAEKASAKDEFKTLNLTLARVEPQTGDAKTLRFLMPPDRRLTARPGQFMTFQWRIGDKLVTRSYSICSSPTQTAFIEITVKRVENGHVSRFLNDQAQPGLTVRASGPYGHFYLDETRHRRIALIAAGSGITPMMGILRYIDDLCLPLHCTLIYCVRTEDDMFFRSELNAIQTRLNGFYNVVVISQPGPGWNGWKGRLRREILEREIGKPLETTFFLCGPPAFMENARTLLTDLSVDASQILQESFGGAVTGNRKPASALEAGLLKLTFARSAASFDVSCDKTLLESSESNGVLIPYGCRQGSCCTCATRLLNGHVYMETEAALSDELKSLGYILPCVSRPLGDVTLDA